MERKRSKLGLVLMTLALFLALALGLLAPGAFAQEVSPQVGAAGLSGRAVLCYYDGGGSSGG